MKIAAIALSAALLASPPIALAADEGEWTYLFENASTGDFYFDFLEETDPESVFAFEEENQLSIKGDDAEVGYLQTLDEYEDFELAFDWRWPDKPGKGGIHIHSTTFPARLIWPESVEIDLDHGVAGDFWLLNTDIEVEPDQMPKKAADRNRRLRLADPKVKEKKPGEWNSMRIVVKDDTIEVFLNGEKANAATESSRSSGYLTFAADGSNLQLRNVRIRELPTED